MSSLGGPRTIVHLLRHGEVHNPTKVLYGRLPGYRLSPLGLRMAAVAADALGAHVDAEHHLRERPLLARRRPGEIEAVQQPPHVVRLLRGEPHAPFLALEAVEQGGQPCDVGGCQPLQGVGLASTVESDQGHKPWLARTFRRRSPPPV